VLFEVLISSVLCPPLLVVVDSVVGMSATGAGDTLLGVSPLVIFGSGFVVDMVHEILSPQITLWLYLWLSTNGQDLKVIVAYRRLVTIWTFSF